MKFRTANYRIMIQCCLIALTLLLVHPSNAQPVEESEDIQNANSDLSSISQVTTSAKDGTTNSIIRSKRTIGFLRQLFPGLSQIVDRKIQQITRVLFRVVGRLILRGGTAGGDSSTAGGSTGADSSGGAGGKGRRISITLPTYPPFEDDEEEDSATNGTSTSETTALSVSPSSIATSIASTVASPTTTIPSTPLVDLNANQISESQDIAKRRVDRDVSDVLSDSTSVSSTNAEEETNNIDSEKKTTDNNNRLLKRIREMRSKRQPFRLGPSNAGESGNFLFDVVRLIAGSGTTPEKDEEINAPREEREDDGNNTNIGENNIAGNSEDTYGAGIPGPLTRLFILVNRGISNMIQDLILRLAQTSERVINFKARLITSII